MKYIRTEIGIFEVTKELYSGSRWVINNGVEYYITYFDIIKQADTIEELIDVVVEENANNSHNLISKHQKEYIKQAMKREHIIKGAIWTDKGLIYVAKMNEKGELELI